MLIKKELMGNGRGKFFKKSVLFFTALVICVMIVGSVFAETFISLDVENTPIETVLKMISQQSGINIVTSQNVTGNVTVRLDNVSVGKALDAVLNVNNYMYERKDDIVSVFAYIDSQQEERFANLVTKVFTLEYSDVTDLRRVLLSMKTARGKIELNPKGNQVIITDTPEKVKEIENALTILDQKIVLKKYKLNFSRASDVVERLRQIIPVEKGQVFVDDKTNSIVARATEVVLRDIDELVAGWDVQYRQVLIEARLVQVNITKNLSMGIDWEFKNSGYNTSRSGGGEPKDLNFKGLFDLGLTSGGIFNVGTLTADEYNIVLEALETKANAEVLSAPRICVLDNEKANILVGSSEPYLVTAQDPTTGFITEQTNFVDVGIKLIVTPKIGENNYVTMVVHPEVSTARRVAEVDNAVAVDTTQADTTMMVKDGETIVLGGLIKSEKQKTIKKIPFLGDIPILGYLFRSKEDEDVKQELIVFITPHILTDTNRQTVSDKDWDSFSERTGTDKDLIKSNMMSKVNLPYSSYSEEKIQPNFEQE
ncbi:MAG: secretin N-terminal domain-containing protein [Candidatus Omnitrophota bacterium]